MKTPWRLITVSREEIYDTDKMTEIREETLINVGEFVNVVN